MLKTPVLRPAGTWLKSVRLVDVGEPVRPAGWVSLSLFVLHTIRAAIRKAAADHAHGLRELRLLLPCVHSRSD
jgi:hypothetical protein